MGITILADVNRVNNLHDPVPFLNRDGAILGIMITCMVGNFDALRLNGTCPPILRCPVSRGMT